MRTLKINTQFFQQEKQQQPKQTFYRRADIRENKIQFNKITGVISIQNKFKTLQLQRLFCFWSKIKFYQSEQNYFPQSMTSRKSEIISSRKAFQRLNQNVIHMKQMSKCITARSSSARKNCRTQSPTYSNQNMNQSRAFILNQIIQKIKNTKRNTRSDVQHLQKPLYKRLEKLQQLLSNIGQKQVKEEKKIKKSKIRKIESKQQYIVQQKSTNINSLCLAEIQKLKIQINEIKKQQQILSKQAQQNCQQTNHHLNTKRQKSCIINLPKPITTQLLLNNNSIKTHRIEFTQPLSHCHKISENRFIQIQNESKPQYNSKSHIFIKPNQLSHFINIPVASIGANSHNCCQQQFVILNDNFCHHHFVKPMSIVPHQNVVNLNRQNIKPISISNCYMPYQIMSCNKLPHYYFYPMQQINNHQHSKSDFRLHPLRNNHQKVMSNGISFQTASQR